MARRSPRKRSPRKRVSRRRFLLGLPLLVAGVAALGLWRWRASRPLPAAPSPIELLELLCGRMIPGHPGVPGADDIGVHRILAAAYQRDPGARRMLDGMALGLEQAGFFALSPVEQTRFIRENLRAGAPRVAGLDAVYRGCASLYLTRPESWVTLGYRQPQPNGHPDFADCSKGDA